MANAKEIRTQIRSIQNTQKITKALEMVAASKIRKAQQRMAASRPYAQKMRQVIGHLSQANPAYRHPFLVEREAKRVGFIVISTDRGLCGGLNINLFKSVLGAIREWHDRGAEIDTTVIGAKGVPFFRRYHFNIVSQATHLGDRPHLEALIGPIKIMLDAYREGRIDRIFLGHNVFENTMVQRPQVSQIVPIAAEHEPELEAHWDYIYEPDSEELLDGVLMRYVESQVYQGVVENMASFQAAQMVAMKSASDNAGELIDELQLAYNKTRQAAITKELAEIVGGAAAV
ncbi:MAG TPA: F0F1 ATP synthase subunit gamma [Gammaproteobacteria bacterium]|nr:F0F1 ATP synthase subunit gamma [Gammaproteobacteria bacterium]